MGGGLDTSMVTMDDIIEYFSTIFKKILQIFGIEISDETSSNIGSMFDELKDYQPGT